MYSQIKALDYLHIADFSVDPIFQELFAHSFVHSVVFGLLLVRFVEKHDLRCLLQIE